MTEAHGRNGGAHAPPFSVRDTSRRLRDQGLDDATILLFHSLLLGSRGCAEGGWLSVPDTPEELTEEFRTSLRTIRRRLTALCEADVVRRVGGGIHVRLPITEEEWLLARKRETQQSLFSRMGERNQKLKNAISSGKEQTEAKRKWNESKPDHLRIKSPKNTSKHASEDRAPALMTYLQKAILKGNLSKIVPRETEANISKMRQLRDAHGGESVRKVIDWLTDPRNWQKARKRCGINSRVPTPGVLLGFDTSLFPMALDAGKPKRREYTEEELTFD